MEQLIVFRSEPYSIYTEQIVSNLVLIASPMSIWKLIVW